MKKSLVVILLLTMLGIIVPAIQFPATVSTAAASNETDPGNSSVNVEQWRMHEISFTSSLTTQLFSGNQSTFEGAAVPSGWSIFGGGTPSISTTVAHSGSNSLKLAGRANSWYSPQYNIYNILKAGGPGKYNFSFWVYVDSLAANPSNGRMLIRGTTAGQYSFFTAGQSYGAASGTISTPVNTWTKYSGSVTVTEVDLANATGTMNLMIDSLPGLTGQNLYMDDVQITKDYYVSPFNDVTVDVTFTGPNNTTMVMPAFWDGENTWKVRFAPTQTGVWTYTTTSSNTSDSGLHNQTGTINCVPYTGNQEIYQKGFVKTMPNTRYFVYNDGTPFFYIGDTHWSMPAEPYSEMFQSLVDDRVSKGFTVYQSEPLGTGYNLRDGLTDVDIAKFKDLDARFAYIANAGLVHTNAQLFFTNEFINNSAAYSTEYLRKLARYWVARYAAYPVMWTTAQETDKTYYGNYGLATNPWRTVFNAVHQYDPYQHPQTAHQENTGVTRASDSAFKDLSGYSWFGAQWAPQSNGQLDFNTAKDYWDYSGGRPAINYEAFYENLWTNEFGARMQGWTAYLNGMYGQGYGVQDIWLYNTTYDESKDTNAYGITITTAMKSVTWQTSKNFNTSTQLGTYMKNFFASMNWWDLTPRFDDTAWFENNGSYYSVASMDNDTYVAYFYNPTTSTGTLKNMDNIPYTAKWYNPLTGVYTDIGTITPSEGQWTIPAKPDTNDWVLVVSKAPVTTVSVNPGSPDGSNDWYVNPLTVAFSASGNHTGVAKTEYSLDGGTTWQSYTEPVTLTQDGKYTVSYRSTDNAGNVEVVKSIDFNLDATAPTITVSGLVDGTYNDSMDITPILKFSDNLSGMDSSKTTVTLDTYGIETGATIPLYTLPLGSHKFIITSSDLAGNTSTQTVSFQTTTSIKALQTLVTRFSTAGWITKGFANSLQDKLAANDLTDFVSIVKAQSGKLIKSQAAGYLLRDAQYLLAKN